MNNLSNVYLVGDAVRDKLMGITLKDKDWVVVGETPEFMVERGFKQVGKGSPVFIHPETKEEWALARLEAKTGKGCTGFSFIFSPDVSLEEDLGRRDLTINSIAMDKYGSLVDPYNGAQDIHDKILRHTSSAFREDPIRVLRVARFIARLGNEWSIHPDTLKEIDKIKESGELEHLAPKRVLQETEKALSEPHPYLYFKTLKELGIFPELEYTVEIE